MVSCLSHASLTISASVAFGGRPTSAIVLVRFFGKCDAAFETSLSSKNPYDSIPSFRFSRTTSSPFLFPWLRSFRHHALAAFEHFCDLLITGVVSIRGLHVRRLCFQRTHDQRYVIVRDVEFHS